MWVVNGMIGCIVAFMMLGGTALDSGFHIGMFGTYLMVNGLTDLFFGIHSKEEMFEAIAAKAAAKKATTKTAKKGKKK